jgi:hypothetical protein
VITDFVAGEDLINLKAIDANKGVAGNQDFTSLPVEHSRARR